MEHQSIPKAIKNKSIIEVKINRERNYSYKTSDITFKIPKRRLCVWNLWSTGVCSNLKQTWEIKIWWTNSSHYRLFFFFFKPSPLLVRLAPLACCTRKICQREPVHDSLQSYRVRAYHNSDLHLPGVEFQRRRSKLSINMLGHFILLSFFRYCFQINIGA